MNLSLRNCGVVSRLAKEIADNNPNCIKEFYINSLVNMEDGSDSGCGVVFRLSSKFSYNKVLLDGIAKLFNSDDWSVQSVRSAIELTVYVDIKIIDMLKLKENIQDENNLN